MNHKKAKELIPQVAESMDLPLDLCRDLIDFHWGLLNRSMASLEHLHIRVEHLGTFNIKSTYHLEDDIESLTDILFKIIRKGTHTPVDVARMTALQIRIGRLKTMVEAYRKDLTDKRENQQLRKEIRAKRDMEEQKADT